ncbi:formyltransferase family protein [Chloroflexota bacterium]
MLKIGWFTTARGMGSQGLFRTAQEAISQGELDARIEFVFCSRETGEGKITDTFFEMVESQNIPLHTFSLKKFKAARQAATTNPQNALPAWRFDYDLEIISLLQDYSINIGILAGYMLVAGPELCAHYNLINLHPATPWGPTGTWQEVIWQLIDARAAQSGVMMHLAIPELDQGPPATYCTFPICGPVFDPFWVQIQGKSVAEIKNTKGEGNQLFRTIREHGVARELPLVVATIRAFSHGNVAINDAKQVIDRAGNVIAGYDLTTEIDKLIESR